MPVKIHYEDNLFLLQSMIKTLQSATELDVDADFFRDKIIEDVFFIDSTLLRIFDTLKQNEQLLRRREYLRSLLRAKNVFIEFLDSLFDSPLGHTEEFAPYISKLRACKNSNEGDVAEIQRLLQEGPTQQTNEDVVSQEEFRSLLRNDETDEDTDTT